MQGTADQICFMHGIVGSLRSHRAEGDPHIFMKVSAKKMLLLCRSLSHAMANLETSTWMYARWSAAAQAVQTMRRHPASGRAWARAASRSTLDLP